MARTQIDKSLIASVNSSSLIATTTNNNAAAGVVGEVMQATRIRSNAIAMTTSTPLNVTQITLSAGDWDVTWGWGVRAGAAATSITTTAASISLTSATLGGGDLQMTPNAAGEVSVSFQCAGNPLIPGIGNEMCFTGCPTRISIASSTTYFLVVTATFTVSTLTGYGGILARRAR